MFVPAIDCVPSEFEVETDETEGAARYSVLTPIAMSDDERRRVGVLTALYPFEEQGILMHEFQFAIAVVDLETDDVFETCDRDMASGYIPDEVRPLVMECVCGAALALIEYVQPAAIYRVTKATRPPEKALVKHDLVTKRFQECGYAVTQRGTDSFNRVFWVMER